jgi:dienelactone hydrolase
MLHRLTPILCVLAAACAQGGSSDVKTPIDVGVPGSGAGQQAPVDPAPPDPGSHGGRDRDGQSILDSATSQERGNSDVDELDYQGMTQEEVSQLFASPAVRYRVHAVPGFQGLYEFVLNNTGSGWQEKFLLQVPRMQPTVPTPLLVVFHKFGSSHGDLLSSGFIPEVRSRGWYAICPLGARQKNFGNLESQINVRASLELVRSLFPIDPTRVYGVGFSMGGGSVVNYAARHLDPRGVMFAAVCDHTGGVSLAHTWAEEYDDNDVDDNIPTPGANLEVPDILESLYGGTPAQQPFAYQRCSTIDLDPFTGLIGAGTDFARNLGHVPTLVWLASGDPTAYLVNQTTAFETHIQAQNANNQLHLAPGTVHAWTTLDPTYVCNWLSQFTLALPRGGTSLADEDGQWLDFFVEQDASGSFTPFTWSVDAAAKRITISGTANLHRLRVLSAAMGVAPTGPVTLDLSTADGTGDIVELLYVPAAPTAVTRDGVPAAGSFDPLAHTFRVTETDPALHHWVVTFP